VPAAILSSSVAVPAYNTGYPALANTGYPVLANDIKLRAA